jgi:hypothetical protein
MGGTTQQPPGGDLAPLLDAMANLTEFHREHEEYYASSPREQAVVLQRHARTLHALADRWNQHPPAPPRATSPFEGATDLNAPAATQLDGVLFMEGGAEPSEITRLKRELRTYAKDALEAGEWLAGAMESSWDVAATLLAIDAFADLLGERHRIIANNWRGASVMTIAGRVLDRAADVLDGIDFSPAAVRADITGVGASARRLWSAAEMIDHAADLLSDFGGLVHDNERRWRVFRARVEQYAATTGASRLDSAPAAYPGGCS